MSGRASRPDSGLVTDTKVQYHPAALAGPRARHGTNASEGVMLVLTRKVGERIHIGAGIVLTVVRIQGDRVRLGITAPPDVAVHREEVRNRMRAGEAAPAVTAGEDD
jgi:carbon storage regulator